MKKSSDYLSKGILISLLLIVIDLVGGFANLRFDSFYKWLGTIVLVIALIVVCIQFSKQQQEGVTFGKVFGYGFKIALFISVLMIVYSLISINLIFPELKDQVLQKARTDMEAKGTMSQDQIDQGVAMTKKFFMPFAIIGAFIGTLIFGIIGSLLGAAFAKKSEPNVFQDNP